MKNKAVFIELLRIASLFLVIVNHTISMLIDNIMPSPTWWASVVYFYICRAAVPIFLMITGFHLLDRVDGWKKSIYRLIKKLMSLAAFSIPYYLLYFDSRGVLYDVINFFNIIRNQYVSNALWYMYVYLSLLVMMPFLQHMAKDMGKNDFVIYIGISLFLNSLLPIIQHYHHITYCSLLSVPLCNGYICYLFIGQYIKRYCFHNAAHMH